jgi:hypothetical protein
VAATTNYVYLYLRMSACIREGDIPPKGVI